MNMKMKWPLLLRKGAWTSQEDDLLRKCIQQHGEGTWHQVPFKAGLNRCRKSCRLRWLNYLKPDIKRGEFSRDEVDLIIRLHKLLGNRWALISGRLPGRTANDVKNFWNTRMKKKKRQYSCKEKEEAKAETKLINKNNIVRPRPRRLSKNLSPTTDIYEVDLLPNSADASFMMTPMSTYQITDNNNHNNDVLESSLFDLGSTLKETTAFIEEEMWSSSGFSMDLELWDLFNNEY